MAFTSARPTVNLKAGVFEHDNARIDKYTLADELPTQLSELGIRPRKMPQPAYSLRRLTTDDKEKVLKFLRRFFFQDEPMNQAVELLETPDSRCIELEEYASSSLKDDVSIAAVDENGDLVGVIINGIARREDAASGSDKSEKCPNPKFQRILRVLEHLDREGRIWERLPASCRTVVEVRIASTHETWRGRGLMRVLCEQSEQIAKELGAGAMRMDTTSKFSAAAAERLKYKKVYSVMYEEDHDWPQPEPPHVEARVYLKEL